MRNILYIILAIIIFTSCDGNGDSVIIPKSEYERLTNVEKPEYPKTVFMTTSLESQWTPKKLTIGLGSDGHEYQLHVEARGEDEWTHYGGCAKCNQRLDSILYYFRLLTAE